MRIGMMTDIYKPHVSGVTNHIALAQRNLTEQGYEVFIFTFGEEGCVEDAENVIRSPGLPLVDTGFYINIRYNLQAQKLLRTMDIVHVHHPFMSGRLALRYCQPRGIPIVFTNHTRYDLYAQAYLPVLPEGISDTLLKAYLPSFCASCDLVIAPSPGLRDVLQRLGVRTHIEVIPNGVDLSPFREPIDPIPREKLGFGKDDVVLIFTGRLAPEKNLPFLLRAFTGTAKTFNNVALLFVGSGPEMDNLEDRVRIMNIAERVHFSGIVPYKDMPRYLATADVFVTASISEVHPLSVIEAMAAGLPVLGIQSPGVGDIVKDGITGKLAPEADLAVFTAMMVRMVTDHKERKRMGAEARKESNYYAIGRTTQILLEHYQRLIREASGRKRGLRNRLYQLLDRITQ